jgi:hypothetical protein
MDSSDHGPSSSEVLADEPAVTMLGCRLAAEQRGANLEVGGLQGVLDLPFGHEREELGFVGVPVAFALLVVVQ